jgi:hypothetical protein
VARRARSGAEADVRCHQAQKGGRGASIRCVRLEHVGTRCGSSCWKPFVVGYGLIQHGMPPVNPCVRLRLTHPTELSLHLVKGMLFHLGQNEEPFVRARRPRTGVIRSVTATRARLPITRAVIHIGEFIPIKL